MALRRQSGWLLAFLLCLCTTPGARAEVTAIDWGPTPQGHAKLYTISSTQMRVQITEFGARIVTLETPDRHGKLANIVLGYNNLHAYVSDPKHYFGAVVGRFANRLAKGTFTLQNQTFHIPLNSAGNALHGGTVGFSNTLWHGRIDSRNSIVLTLTSSDGDMGFPGRLSVTVRYAVQGNGLRIDYSATTNKPTILNLTNHSYFNLAGEDSGSVLQQQIRINADRFTPVDATLIPTGELRSVKGTPFDLRHLTPIGAHLHDTNEQLQRAKGYDQNFVLRGQAGKLKEAAFAFDPGSGRTLDTLTTQPGLQFYSGNVLDGTVIGYSTKPYAKYAGFCLETQHFPDAPNHPGFPSTVLLAGQTFHATTIFRFGVR